MIVEKIHNKRLKEQGISICSKYKSNDTILERNTDKTKRNDNIQNGICLEKDYYKNNKLICSSGQTLWKQGTQSQGSKGIAYDSRLPRFDAYG